MVGTHTHTDTHTHTHNYDSNPLYTGCVVLGIYGCWGGVGAGDIWVLGIYGCWG